MWLLIYILFRFIYKYIYVRNDIGVEIDAAIPLPRPIIMRSLRYDAYLEQTKFPIAERLAACLHVYPDHGCMFYPQEILSHVPSLKLSCFGYKNRLLLEWLRGRFYVSFSERFCNCTCSQAHWNLVLIESCLKIWSENCEWFIRGSVWILWNVPHLAKAQLMFDDFSMMLMLQCFLWAKKAQVYPIHAVDVRNYAWQLASSVQAGQIPSMCIVDKAMKVVS